MRQLLPELIDEVDPEELYPADERPVPDERPWLVVNMVASVDGAITVDGRSGGLGGPADLAAFRALRGVADVILVGAGTVRAERYGPPRTTDDQRRARASRGQAAWPRLAIVSGRLDLDLGAELFTATPSRPLVLTGQGAEPARLRAVAEVADVIETPGAQVDVGVAMARLRAMGCRVVLCEGGPTLNGHLLAAGLVDELCVTIAPLVVGGDSARMVAASEPAAATPLRLARLLEADGVLLARYVRA